MRQVIQISLGVNINLDLQVMEIVIFNLKESNDKMVSFNF